MSLFWISSVVRKSQDCKQNHNDRRIDQIRDLSARLRKRTYMTHNKRNQSSDAVTKTLKYKNKYYLSLRLTEGREKTP